MNVQNLIIFQTVDYTCIQIKCVNVRKFFNPGRNYRKNLMWSFINPIFHHVMNIITLE